MQGYNMWQQMVSETEEVCALNVTRVFMVSSTEMWDGSWTVLTCITAQVPANNTWQTRRCKECTRKRAHVYPAHEVEFLCLAVRSGSASADGKKWISSSTKNPMVLLDLSSRASPYQPAGNTGATNILPSRPFCAWQRASRVQSIQSKQCCNLPTGAN